MAIGLNIDFTVHISVEYVTSPHRHRKHKVSKLMKNIGSTLLNCAIIQICSGAFLFGANTQYL